MRLSFEEEYLLYFLGFTLAYLVIYYLVPTRDSSPAAAKSRIVSAIHAAICLACVLYWAVYYGAEFDFGNGHRVLRGLVMAPSDLLFSVTIASSAGYFASDLLIMWFNPDAYDHMSLAHHLILIPAFLVGAVTRVTVPLQFLFLVEELSTVFLNIRWFCRDQPKAYALYSQLFAVTFILSRMVFGTGLYVFAIFTYTTQGETIFPDPFHRYIWWISLSLCTFTRFLNCYWTSLILQKVFFPKKEKM